MQGRECGHSIASFQSRGHDSAEIAPPDSRRSLFTIAQKLHHSFEGTSQRDPLLQSTKQTDSHWAHFYYHPYSAAPLPLFVLNGQATRRRYWNSSKDTTIGSFICPSPASVHCELINDVGTKPASVSPYSKVLCPFIPRAIISHQEDHYRFRTE